MKTIQTLGGKGYGAVKTESRHRPFQIVVNGFRHPDHPQPLLRQGVSDGHGAVAADGDEGIDLVQTESPHEFVSAVHFLDAAVRVADGKMQRVAAIGGAQYGATQVGDAANAVARQGNQTAFDIAFGHQQAVEA